MNFTARMAANKGDRIESGDIHLDFGCCHTDSPIPAEVIHPLDGAPADPSSHPALAVQRAGSNPHRGPLPFEPMRLHASACSRSIRARSRYNSRNISREREGAATPFFTSILAHESSSDAKVKPRLFWRRFRQWPPVFPVWLPKKTSQMVALQAEEKSKAVFIELNGHHWERR